LAVLGHLGQPQTLQIPPQRPRPSKPMTSISLIIFDWDGTVVDSTMTIAQAIQRSC